MRNKPLSPDRVAVTLALSLIAVSLTGCTLGSTPGSSSTRAPQASTGEGVKTTEQSDTSSASSQPSEPAVGSEEARSLAVEACTALQQTAMEFPHLPGAYAQAEQRAGRAATGDSVWAGFAAHVSASRISFTRVQAGSESDNDFQTYQRDLSAMNADCVALGVSLLDD